MKKIIRVGIVVATVFLAAQVSVVGAAEVDQSMAHKAEPAEIGITQASPRTRLCVRFPPACNIGEEEEN
ncbi:hypothetical protein IC757_09495 [Wenzhouxiangella sp. AB-CW3]|uniref:hypothetical protein n=1 Tax=Wenzhouxiangella sp. AB-CW3 TaxID=2771012 RepID=UPI00168BE431|nr:hypothetical protein [Wenzhouxiangella sp. AB-CW3]QOC21288.1 hypothetical protein IC757_09495 [Wenzhouxiangella sp. AB-CW3]